MQDVETWAGEQGLIVKLNVGKCGFAHVVQNNSKRRRAVTDFLGVAAFVSEPRLGVSPPTLFE